MPWALLGSPFRGVEPSCAEDPDMSLKHLCLGVAVLGMSQVGLALNVPLYLLCDSKQAALPLSASLLYSEKWGYLLHLSGNCVCQARELVPNSQ